MTIKEQVLVENRLAKEEGPCFLVPMDGYLVRRYSRDSIGEPEFFYVNGFGVVYGESKGGFPDKYCDVTDLFEEKEITSADLEGIADKANTGIFSHELFIFDKYETDKNKNKAKNVWNALIDSANKLGLKNWEIAAYSVSKQAEEDMDKLAGMVIDLENSADSLYFRDDVDEYSLAYKYFKRWIMSYLDGISDKEREELEGYWGEAFALVIAPELVEDRQRTLVQNLADKAGVSYRKMKAKLLDIERGVARSIKKKDPKFWPIVISTLKKSFGII